MGWKYKEYGLKIKTFFSVGQYHHIVMDIGVGPDGTGRVSDEVVETLKKANEALYEEMPEGSKNLISVIKYAAPKKKK